MDYDLQPVDYQPSWADLPAPNGVPRLNISRPATFDERFNALGPGPDQTSPFEEGTQVDPGSTPWQKPWERIASYLNPISSAEAAPLKIGASPGEVISHAQVLTPDVLGQQMSQGGMQLGGMPARSINEAGPGLRGTERTGGVAEAPGAPAEAGVSPIEPALVKTAQLKAQQAAAGRQPLEGLPQEPLKAAGYFVPGPIGKLHDIAEQYMQEQGLPYNPPKTYAPVNRERAENIAQEFEDMRHDPSDPDVAASYKAMANETLAQYQAIKNAGIRFDFIQPGMKNPYAETPRLAAKDLQDNNHLWVFPTESGFATEGVTAAGGDHPLLRDSGETLNGKPMTINDVFRIVHDVFGHFKDGNGFRAGGEENAWRSHSAMYSDAARPAMTSETRGQNSWVNFGPHGEANRKASADDTVYSDQKAGLLPDWVVNEGRHDPGYEAPPSPYVQRGINEPQRNDYPGIYDDPRTIAAKAAARVAPEHPALKELFGVTRDDLYGISQQGTRPGNMEPYLPGAKDNPRGSYMSNAIMTPQNAQRLVDIGAEAGKYPELRKGMDAWYVMDPAYQRLEQLHGPELAKQLYNQHNIVGSMHSPGSDVETEINRGTAANELINSGGWARASRRWSDPGSLPGMGDVRGHPYGTTAQAGPVNKWLQSNSRDYQGAQMSQPKVPLYMQASGVPQTGFQTSLPVPDAHFTRGVGMSDVRTNAKPGASMKTPEYAKFGPWYRENVAKPLGIQPVSAQARQWGALGHATGVETQIGAPKLEILAKRIWEKAQREGIDPKVLRDKVLSGQGHVRLETPNQGVG